MRMNEGIKRFKQYKTLQGKGVENHNWAQTKRIILSLFQTVCYRDLRVLIVLYCSKRWILTFFLLTVSHKFCHTDNGTHYNLFTIYFNTIINKLLNQEKLTVYDYVKQFFKVNVNMCPL